MAASDLSRFCISIPTDLLARFEEYAARRGITKNRSEVIRDLMREALSANEIATAPESVVAGTLSMVYDHHQTGLTRKLDDLQHQFTHEIISTLHVHLDHHNCLEVVVLRGKASRIQEIADKILGVKGIYHGKLNVTPYKDEIPCPCNSHSDRKHNHN